jgi:hypothetical protein
MRIRSEKILHGIALVEFNRIDHCHCHARTPSPEALDMIPILERRTAGQPL